MANDCINLLRIEAENIEAVRVIDNLRALTFDFGGSLWLGEGWQRAARRADRTTLTGAVLRFLASAHAGYPRLAAGDHNLAVTLESRWDPPIRAAAALARSEPGRTVSLLYAEPLNGFAGLVSLRDRTTETFWRTDDLAEGDQRLLALGFDFDATYREALDLEWAWYRSSPSWTPEAEAFRAELRALARGKSDGRPQPEAAVTDRHHRRCLAPGRGSTHDLSSGAVR